MFFKQNICIRILLLLSNIFLVAYGSTTRATAVTNDELKTLTEALLTMDTDNNVADLITVNLQGRTSFHSTQDKASNKLLTVKPEAYSKTTIAKILPLLDNYYPNASRKEEVTNGESTEEVEFLTAILATPIMKRVKTFLTDKGYITRSSYALQNSLKEMWFGMYRRERGGEVGSSGFEHVFLGEIKNNQVSGFHNWIYFALEEEKGELNYRGHLGGEVNLGTKGRIVKDSFTWKSHSKPLSSMFIGTSPEFEVAIYSLCFFLRQGQCDVKLNDVNVKIQTHKFTQGRKQLISSAYPDI